MLPCGSVYNSASQRLWFYVWVSIFLSARSWAFAYMWAFVFVCASLRCFLFPWNWGHMLPVTSQTESKALKADILQHSAVNTACSNTVCTWGEVRQCCCEEATEHILFLTLHKYSQLWNIWLSLNLWCKYVRDVQVFTVVWISGYTVHMSVFPVPCTFHTLPGCICKTSWLFNGSPLIITTALLGFSSQNTSYFWCTFVSEVFTPFSVHGPKLRGFTRKAKDKVCALLAIPSTFWSLKYSTWTFLNFCLTVFLISFCSFSYFSLWIIHYLANVL